MMPALLNRARSVFFEDSSAMKWLNQMLEEPGHLTVHFSELLEAMPEVTGTPVPGNLASCFVPGKARRPALQGRALPPKVEEASPVIRPCCPSAASQGPFRNMQRPGSLPKLPPLHAPPGWVASLIHPFPSPYGGHRCVPLRHHANGASATGTLLARV